MLTSTRAFLAAVSDDASLMARVAGALGDYEAGTAAWIAGVFELIPAFGWLAGIVGGLYSLYLLYLGLPKLMKVSGDKALLFTAAAAICALIAGFLVGIVTNTVLGPLMMATGTVPA